MLPKWPPKDAAPLLIGKAVNPDKPAQENPAAWTWTNQRGDRAFFTTLEHPGVFRAEALQRLLVNAVHWRLGLPVPEPWKGLFKLDAPYRGIRTSAASDQ